MASFTDAQLTNAAQNLAGRARQDNPAHNPGAIRQIPQEAQPLVAAVLSSPKHSQIARGEVAGSQPAAGNGNALDPHGQTRKATQRVQLLGFTSALIGSALTVGVTATPYAPFTGKKIAAAPFTLGTGGISGSSWGNLQVGVRPQFAALGQEPLDTLAAGLTAGFVELDEATPAIGISMNVTLSASATFYGAIVGTTRKAKDANRPPEQYRKIMRLPIADQSAGYTGNLNVTVTPTFPFWGRKIVIGEPDGIAECIMGLTSTGATGAAGINVTGLYVGANPQFMNLPTASAPVPASIFNAMAEHMWLDLDMADTAVPIVFQTTVIGTVSCFFGGVIDGDCDTRSIATNKA